MTVAARGGYHPEVPEWWILDTSYRHLLTEVERASRKRAAAHG